MSSDHGNIVLGWLTKVTVVLALFGVIFFDALSIGSARLGVEDQSRAAAQSASTVWVQTKDCDQAFDAGARTIGDDLQSELVRAAFVCYPDGRVSAQVQRVAPTIVVSRVGPISQWATVKAVSEVGPLAAS